MTTPLIDARTPALLKRAGEGELVVIADDLTGACDSGVMFAQQGLKTVVVWDERVSVDADVVVYCTESRDVQTDVARARLTEASARVKPGATVFKKVDSIFRGNTIYEIGILPELFPGRVIVVAPAYPALGRSVEQGNVMVSDLSGSRLIRVLEQLRARDVAVHGLPARESAVLIEAEVREALRLGVRFLFADAENQAHLDALVMAFGRIDEEIVWVGAGGLAKAMVGGTTMTAPIPTQRGAVVIFSGTEHPVTEDQLACVGGRLGESDVCLRIRWEDGPGVVETVGRMRREEIGCFVMTGGDTAIEVCRELGIEALELVAEFAPGLPIAVARGGRFDGVTVVLKSGGFGKRDVLCDVLERFGNG